ncbi:MAG: hypothetical protein ACRED4_00070 [Brevundimonas sp.]
MRILLTLIMVMNVLTIPRVLNIWGRWFGFVGNEETQLALQAVAFQLLVIIAVFLWVMDLGRYGWRGRP